MTAALSDFDLHILTGEPDLFYPGTVSVTDLVQAISPAAYSAPTGWLSREMARGYHDFLLDGEDRRVVVMARCLSTDFGGQAQPCLVLPSLATPLRRSSAYTMLSALAAALAQYGEVCRFLVHGIGSEGRSLPLPVLRDLVAELSGLGLRAVLPDKPIIIIMEDSALGREMRRNTLATALAGELILLAREHGLRPPKSEVLAVICETWLAALAERGFIPTAPSSSEAFAKLAALIFDCVLTDGSSKGHWSKW